MRKKAGWTLSERDIGNSRVKNVRFSSRILRLKKGFNTYIIVKTYSGGLISVRVSIVDNNVNGQDFELQNYLNLKDAMREGVTLDPLLLADYPPQDLFDQTVTFYLAKNGIVEFDKNIHTGEITLGFSCGMYSDTYRMKAGEANKVLITE